MSSIIPIQLAVEDDLGEAIMTKIFIESGRNYFITACYGKKGNTYLKQKIAGFNSAAKGSPFLVLTDLDNEECAVMLIEEWLHAPKHHNLLFRVAVREVESWILAHRAAFAKFLGIKQSLIPESIESIPNPKELLILLASKSRYRNLRESIVPAIGSTAKKGPDYNAVLSFFVSNNWSAFEASKHSNSLRRAMSEIQSFVPQK